MGEYRLVCLDIDGTLLNSMHMISDKTKEAIGRVVNEKHISVILVSARMPDGMIFLQKELKLEEPMICYNGALIWDSMNIVSDVSMTISQVQLVLQFARELEVHLSIYKGNKWYIESMDEWALQESEITNGIPTIVDFDNLTTEWHKNGIGPNKILVMSNAENVKVFRDRLKISYTDNLSIYPSKPTYIEITSSKATKTSAIELICQKYGIKSSEVIAIGDNFNDISMIKYAGLGISMGNAPEPVKLVADEITNSCDDDGVANALIKHIIGR